MRLLNSKKLEFYIKKLLRLPEPALLKRRAERYFIKNTERELRIIHKILDSSKASIDIGVYRGVYSFYLLKYSSFVYAFEANPLLHEKLIRGFEKEKLIKIENYAISSKNGSTTLRIPIRDISADYDEEEKYQLGTATIHSENNLGKQEYEEFRDIQMIRLDDYNFNHEIGFIKIDVEGHELEVIRGSHNLIKKYKPCMLIEIEERHSGLNPQDTILEIKELGYECFFVDDKFQICPYDFSNKLDNYNFIFMPKS